MAGPLGQNRCQRPQGRRRETTVNSGEAACRHSRLKLARRQRSRTRCIPSWSTGWIAVRYVMDTVIFMCPHRRRRAGRFSENLRGQGLTATLGTSTAVRTSPTGLDELNNQTEFVTFPHEMADPQIEEEIRPAVPSSPIGLRSPIRHNAVLGRYRGAIRRILLVLNTSCGPVSGPEWRRTHTQGL